MCVPMVIGWQCRSSSAEQTRATEARIHRGGAVLWTRGRVGERTVRWIDPHETRNIDRQEAAGSGRGCSRMRKCRSGGCLQAEQHGAKTAQTCRSILTTGQSGRDARVTADAQKQRGRLSPTDRRQLGIYARARARAPPRSGDDGTRLRLTTAAGAGQRHQP